MKTKHPTAELLEAFAENALAAPERAEVDAHLVGCPRCGSAVEEWRHLFGALGALPRYAPAPGFSERILAAVQVRLPWHARAARMLGRLLPGTNRGWALVAAIFSVPMVAAGGFLVWLLSKSYITATALWIFTVDRGSSLISSAFSTLAASIMGSGPVVTAVGWTQSFMVTAGPRGIGAALISGAGLTALSSWFLYRNLRNPNRNETHVTFVF